MKKRNVILILLGISIFFLGQNYVSATAFLDEPEPVLNTDRQSYCINEIMYVNASWNIYVSQTADIGIKIIAIDEDPNTMAISTIIDRALYIYNCPIDSGSHYVETSVNLTSLDTNDDFDSIQIYVLLVFFNYIGDFPSTWIGQGFYQKTINISKYTPIFLENWKELTFDYNPDRIIENELRAEENHQIKYLKSLVNLDVFSRNQLISSKSLYLTNLTILKLDLALNKVENVGSYLLCFTIFNSSLFRENVIFCNITIEKAQIMPLFLNSSKITEIPEDPEFEIDFYLQDMGNQTIDITNIEWQVRTSLDLIRISKNDYIYQLFFENPYSDGEYSINISGNNENYTIMENSFNFSFTKRFLDLNLIYEGYSKNNTFSFQLTSNVTILFEKSCFQLQIYENASWKSENYEWNETIANNITLQLDWNVIMGIFQEHNCSILSIRIKFEENALYYNQTSNPINLPLPPIADFKTDQQEYVLGQEICFYFCGITFSTNNDYFWDFGDGTNSSLMNPLHIYEKDGNYNISLYLFDELGYVDFIEKDFFITIVEDLTPSISFIANLTSIFTGDDIEFIFTGNFGNDPALIYWDFGDGDNSTGTEVVHKYSLAGNFTLQINIRDIDGDEDFASFLNYIEVEENILPHANFTYLPSKIITELDITFNFTGSFGNLPCAIFWDFGDGGNSTYINPLHSFQTPGRFKVSLQLVDANTEYDYFEKWVNVEFNLQPFGEILILNNSYYLNEDLYFIYNGTFGNTPVSYLWDFGDGTNSIDLSPSHQYHYEGIYQVIFRMIDFDGDVIERNLTINITENLIPEANFIVNRSVLIAGEEIEFIFTGKYGNKQNLFFWDFGDGYNSSQQNPNHIFSIGGNYTISLCIWDEDFDMDESYATIVILDDLKPSISFIKIPLILYQESSYTFIFNGSCGNSPSLIFWEIEGELYAINTTKISLVIPKNISRFSLTLSIIDFDGDINSSMHTFVVKKNPKYKSAIIFGGFSGFGGIATVAILRKMKIIKIRPKSQMGKKIKI